MDDIAYLERFLPTLRSWQEAIYTPEALRDWFGPLQRPLTLLSLQFDRWLWGGAAVQGFHVTQAAWYGTVVAAFTALAAALLRGLAPQLPAARARAATWIAGLLFAIHPTHVEPAAWISTRADVLFALFLLLGLLSAIRALESHRPGRTWLWGAAAAGCGVLSVQAKETGYALFLLVPALLALWPQPWRWQRQALPLLAPAAAALLVCLLLRQETPARPWRDDAVASWLSALGWGLTSSVLPLSPRLLYDPPPHWLWGVLGLAGGAAWLVHSVHRLRRGQRLPFYVFLFTLATLAPTWMIAWKRIMAAIVSDRYLMLPVGGVLLLAALPLSAPRWQARAAAAAWAALFLVLGGRYALAWHGPPQALAVWTVEHAPLSVTARTCSVLRALRADDIQTARALFDVAPPPREQQDEEGNYDALRATILFFEGNWGDAVEAARRSAERDRDNPRRWQELGFMLYEAFREAVDEPQDGQVLPRLLGDARNALTLAVRFDPRAYYAWETLGRTLASMGDMDGARQAFQKVTEIAPGTEVAAFAVIRSRLLPDPATFQWEELERIQLRLASDEAPAARWSSLGTLLYEYSLDVAYAAPGGGAPSLLLQEAQECLEQALARQPELAAAHLKLGLVRATLGDLDGARRSFEQVLARSPGSLSARYAQLNLRRLEEQG